MAAAVFQYETIVQYAQRHINDVGVSWLTAADYTARMIEQLEVNSQNLQFIKRGTGIYKYPIGEDYLLWFDNQANLTSSVGPFTGSDNATYQLDCGGTIYVSAGTHSGAEPIVISCAQVHIGKFMSDLFLSAASMKATTKGSSSSGSTSYQVALDEDRCIKMAERWLGVH